MPATPYCGHYSHYSHYIHYSYMYTTAHPSTLTALISLHLVARALQLPTAASAVEVISAMAQDISSAKGLRQLVCAALRAVSRLTTSLHGAMFVVGEDDGSMLYAAFQQVVALVCM